MKTEAERVAFQAEAARATQFPQHEIRLAMEHFHNDREKLREFFGDLSHLAISPKSAVSFLQKTGGKRLPPRFYDQKGGI